MKLAYFTAKKHWVLVSFCLTLCVCRFVCIAVKIIRRKNLMPRWCLLLKTVYVCVWLTIEKERNERNNKWERGRTTDSSTSSSNKHTDYGTSYICISRNTHTLIHTLFVNRDIWLFNLSLYHFRQHTNTVSLLSVCVFVCASECLYFC